LAGTEFEGDIAQADHGATGPLEALGYVLKAKQEV
jgi:hypothetical protein